MPTSKILFTCRPLSGHFDPLVGLARATQTAGHSVAFASGDPVVERARAAGFQSFRAGHPESFRSEWAPSFPGFRSLVGDEQRQFFFTEIFANLELAGRAPELDAVIAAWQPDVVVHEVAELAAPMICADLGIRCVDVGYGPLVSLSVLRAAGTAAAKHWEGRGLRPDPLAGLFRDLYIDPCPPGLQTEEIVELSPTQLMRPVDTARVVKPSESWFAHDLRRPTVYVTMGTIWNTDLDMFRLIVEALRDHYNVIVTVGRQNDPDALGPQPANVVIRSYIPQDELLPQCDIAVVHGGAGTVLGAVAHGVPLLVLPQGADQWSNASRVVASGAGRLLLRGDITVDAVRGEVGAIVADHSFRDAARRLADEIGKMPTVEEAAAAIVA